METPSSSRGSRDCAFAVVNTVCQHACLHQLHVLVCLCVSMIAWPRIGGLKYESASCCSCLCATRSFSYLRFSKIHDEDVVHSNHAIGNVLHSKSHDSTATNADTGAIHAGGRFRGRGKGTLRGRSEPSWLFEVHHAFLQYCKPIQAG